MCSLSWCALLIKLFMFLSVMVDCRVKDKRKLKKDECTTLLTKYDIVSTEAFEKLSLELKKRWMIFQCDKNLNVNIGNYSSEDSSSLLHVNHTASIDRNSDRTIECKQMLTTYGVQVNNWGTLPVDMQKRWGGYHCDRLLSRQDSIQISSVPTVQIIPTSNKSANSSKSDAKITQCNEWLSKYAVVVGSTWGQAPLEIQKQWTILGCDAIILPAPGSWSVDAENKESDLIDQGYIARINTFPPSAEKRVISFCLYGNPTNPEFPKYYRGAIENIKLRDIYYKGWVIRYYVSEEIPAALVQELSGLGAEIVKITKEQQMFGRFLVGVDPTVDRYLVRDIDSRLNSRERIAVEEWINSTMPIHSMRDHPNHCFSFNGGLWGAVKGGIPNLKQRLDGWNSKTGYMKDMDFLASLWPEVQRQVFSQDSYCCKKYQGTQPFSTQRLPNYQHIGQVFDRNNVARAGDIDGFLRGRQNPLQCRGRPEWIVG